MPFHTNQTGKNQKSDNINCWYGGTENVCQYLINILYRERCLYPKPPQFDNQVYALEKH